MIKKLLVFTVTLLILAAPAFGQWATQPQYPKGHEGYAILTQPASAMDYEDESPIGLYVGVGSSDFSEFSVKTGLVLQRWTDRFSTSVQLEGKYNEDADKGNFNLGAVAFYFLGEQRDLYLRGGWVPGITEGEKADFKVTKAGIGYMNRDGKLPLGNVSVGFPYILDIGKDLSSGKWEIHGLMYFEF